MAKDLLDSDMPEFRLWAEDPANSQEVDALAAQFIAEEGVEMVDELIACRGQQHQWAAERWMDRLAERFERWWSQGRPLLKSSATVTITYSVPMMEREAEQMLASNLPPGAGFSLARNWRKGVGGATEMTGWSCKIEDQMASAMGQGSTPAVAAGKAIAMWKEFVSESRVAASWATASDEVRERPPLLDAPSGDASAAGDAEREQAG